MLTASREFAFKVLLRVETEESYAVELLNAPAADRLSPKDRALAQEIVMGCLRWQAQLDWLAAHFAGKDPARWDAEVRIAVRMGIYQVRFLERVPASAAVNQSVELVKRARRRSAAGLVNAVLRKVTREPIESLLPRELAGIERLAIETSHPTWLLDRWIRHYGAERAQAIARINNEPPRVFARAPLDTAVGQPCHYVRNCRDLTGEPREIIRQYPLQDEASQIVPHLLAPQPEDSVLDLCAAPGIKTGAILEMAPGARVIAADLYPARLRIVQRLAGPGAHLLALDGTRALPLKAQFTRILVDVPCTGTGTIRRNPEIKWRLRLSDLEDLPARQRSLLSNALDHLTPGGRLVYSTCSIEPEENAAVVESVLAGRSEVRIVPVKQLPADLLTDAGRALLGGQYLQTLPDQGLDGFFAAMLQSS